MSRNKIALNLKRFIIAFIVVVLVTSITLTASNVWAWDSAAWNPTHPTHSYLTEWAIDKLKDQYPDLQQFRKVIIQGANTELHELPVLGTRYGIDLEVKRIEHQGTNEGCNDIQGWWQDSQAAFKQGNKDQAYFYLGVMLHMIEDMGVPAHANKVYHQGNLTQFDNFEFLAISNWKPNFNDINRQDPAYNEAWRYYAFSQDWTHADAPNYKDRNSFHKFWFTANSTEKKLLRNRQGRTSYVAKWALNSAVKTFTQM